MSQLFSLSTATQTFPWNADLGDGNYRNPIIFADYSDPDVVRVGEDFYLVASSFNCTPGLPILHSRDLVNWTIINHALKNLPDSRYVEVQPGCGVWAPAIRFHAGKYWIFFPTPDEGIYVTTATHPAEKWSEPHLMQAGKGLIDPCPFWDDDGQAYLVHAYAGSRAGIKHRLRVCPMAPDGSKLLGEGKIVFHDPEKQPTLEGPKFLKKDGWYYILAPAGGVETGWQLALRAKNIYGPYAEKIVLAQGRTEINGPHQGALVDTAAGDWWFLHFQDAGVYGRIVHLQPVVWEAGWPLMGTNGEPVLQFQKPVAAQIQNGPQTSDEFDALQLGRQWQWGANHYEYWSSLVSKNSWLRLFPQFCAEENLGKLPNLLLQKFPAPAFAVETSLVFKPQQNGEAAGLVVVGETFAALALQKTNSGNELIWWSDAGKETLASKLPDEIKLLVKVSVGGECRFSFFSDKTWVDLPKTFAAQKGKWIGAKVGLFSLKTLADATAGYVEFDYFRFCAGEH